MDYVLSFLFFLVPCTYRVGLETNDAVNGAALSWERRLRGSLRDNTLDIRGSNNASARFSRSPVSCDSTALLKLTERAFSWDAGFFCSSILKERICADFFYGSKRNQVAHLRLQNM